MGQLNLKHNLIANDDTNDEMSQKPAPFQTTDVEIANDDFPFFELTSTLNFILTTWKKFVCLLVLLPLIGSFLSVTYFQNTKATFSISNKENTIFEITNSITNPTIWRNYVPSNGDETLAEPTPYNVITQNELFDFFKTSIGKVAFEDNYIFENKSYKITIASKRGSPELIQTLSTQNKSLDLTSLHNYLLNNAAQRTTSYLVSNVKKELPNTLLALNKSKALYEASGTAFSRELSAINMQIRNIKAENLDNIVLQPYNSYEKSTSERSNLMLIAIGIFSGLILASLIYFASFLINQLFSYISYLRKNDIYSFS